MTLHPNEDLMAQAPQSPEAQIGGTSADLRWYIAITRRHRVLIVAIAALMIAATLLFTMQQTPLYTAITRVLVKPVGVSNYNNSVGSTEMPTEAGIASSDGVAQIAKDATGSSESANSLLSSLKVDSPNDTTFLEFSYTDASPIQAQTLSTAFANAYVKNRGDKAKAQVEEQVQPLQDELDTLSKSMPGIIGKLQHTKDPAALAMLTQQLSYAQGRAGYLRQQLLPFKQALTSGGEVVLPAELPTSPSSPSYPRNMALALVFGLALGVGVALVRERLDDRLRGTRDLDSAIGAPILATIPKVPNWKKRERVVMITSVAPRGPVSEAYRTLRTNLQFIGKDEDFKVIVITSPGAGEGKTTTVANLAATIAQTGQRVIAISCDLRKPRLHGFFGLSNEVGLSSILTGTATLAEAVQTPEGIDTLRIIASGPVPANPAELLGSQEMTDVIDELRFHADFILLDAPPVLAVSDPLILGPRSDGILVVADAQTTARSAASHSREQLEQVGCNIIGCVLNNFDPNQIRYYPYQNAYYYSSYYSGYKGYGGKGGYGYGDSGPTDEQQVTESTSGSNGHKTTVAHDDEMWTPS